jgi:hypothetical protein
MGHRDPLNDPLNTIQMHLLNALKTKPKADYAIPGASLSVVLIFKIAPEKTT